MFFNPFFVQPQQFDASFWNGTKTWTDAHARATAWAAEGAKMEAKARAQAVTLVDEWARLSKATLDYNAEIAAEMRKSALDAMKPAATGA